MNSLNKIYGLPAMGLQYKRKRHYLTDNDVKCPTELSRAQPMNYRDYINPTNAVVCAVCRKKTTFHAPSIGRCLSRSLSNLGR